MWHTQVYFTQTLPKIREANTTTDENDATFSMVSFFFFFSLCVNFGLDRRLLGKFSKDVDRMAKTKKKKKKKTFGKAIYSRETYAQTVHVSARRAIFVSMWFAMIVIAIETATFK